MTGFTMVAEDGGREAGAHLPPAMVGRGQELRLLLGALRHPPSVVLVEGDAGVGKSRLILEARRTLEAEGAHVLTGLCHPLREPMPYGPVVDALREAAPLLSPDGGVVAAAAPLAPLLPELARWLPAPPAGSVATAGRHAMVRAIRALLEHLGAATLVVEDVHWADEATRECLLLLARDLPAGLGLVVSYRREDLPPGTGPLGSAYNRPPGVTGAVVPLLPLGEPAIAELTAGILGRPAAAGVVQAVFERSGGVPLVAEEDVHALLDRSLPAAGPGGGHLLEDGGVPAADDVHVLAGAGVPRALREVVVGRLATLSAPERSVVEAAAVLEVPSGERVLGGTADLGADEARAALTEVLRRGVLSEFPGLVYGFHHVLYRQAVYGGIPGPERTGMHRRALRVLGEEPAPPLVKMAHHARAAGDGAAWLRYAQAAAAQAAAVRDDGTAVVLLNDILRHPNLAADDRARAAVALSEAVVTRIEYRRSTALLKRILHDPQLPATVRGEIRLTLGRLMVNQDDDPDGRRQLEQAIVELGEERPETASRAMVALALMDDTPAREQRQWLERAERLLAGSGDAAARAAFTVNKLSCLASRGDPEVWAELDALPRVGPEPILFETARGLYNGGEAAALLGHDDRARRLAQEARELGLRLESDILTGYARGTLFHTSWRQGRWDEALAEQDALRGDYPDLVTVQWEDKLIAGATAVARGDLVRGLEALTDIVRSGTGRHVLWEAAAWIARVRLTQDDPEAAWAQLERPLAQMRATDHWAAGHPLIPVVVRTALVLGDTGTARDVAVSAGQATAHCDTPAADAALHTAQGLLAPGSARTAHFERALAARQDIARPYDTALAMEDCADALSEASPDEAVELLRRALATYEGLRAAWDAGRCTRALRELGAIRPQPRGRAGYGNELSPRELQVARYLAEGATNKEIAQALFLSPRTVEQHVHKVLHKLGVARADVPGIALPRTATGRSPATGAAGRGSRCAASDPTALRRLSGRGGTRGSPWALWAGGRGAVGRCRTPGRRPDGGGELPHSGSKDGPRRPR
ncbi:AAA family ATPase [Kitasatospora purpeofusca]|uniref:helix-turn-helix transcriptional regulator n=1 Tax=Kitasatospora purpeofusca TaxID=67352 RepID=UPI0035E39274